VTPPDSIEVPEPRTHDTAARLVGRRVALRAVAVTDYDFLYDISMAPDNVVRWRFRGTTPSPEGFIQTLWQGVMAQFLIVRPSNGAPVGLITAYNTDPRSGTTHIALIVAPPYENQGWVMDAVPLFLGYLFDTWNLRKIYYETIEFNYARFASGLGTRFHVEGCLRDHEYHAGRYWHVYTLAVYREEWEQRAERVMPYVLGTTPPGARPGPGPDR
jgi:RimJ/RimL family protein N-acetyltransferase